MENQGAETSRKNVIVIQPIVVVAVAVLLAILVAAAFLVGRADSSSGGGSTICTWSVYRGLEDPELPNLSAADDRIIETCK